MIQQSERVAAVDGRGRMSGTKTYRICRLRVDGGKQSHLAKSLTPGFKNVVSSFFNISVSKLFVLKLGSKMKLEYLSRSFQD